MQLVGDHVRGSSVIVSEYIVAWIGIPIAVGIAYGIAYLVFRKRKSKVLAQIAFAIWVIIVIIGSVGISQPID